MTRHNSFTTCSTRRPAGATPLRSVSSSGDIASSASVSREDSPLKPVCADSPLHSMDQSRALWLEQQQQHARERAAARHAAFIERHEDAIAAAVPIEVRLRILLAEGRRFERLRSVERVDEPANIQALRLKYVDTAYANLIEDVRRRCAVIAAHNPQPAQQHALGCEAIGCFSSMLPWTEGIVAAEPTSAASLSSASPASAVGAMSGSGDVLTPLRMPEAAAPQTQQQQQQPQSPVLLPPAAADVATTGPSTPAPPRSPAASGRGSRRAAAHPNNNATSSSGSNGSITNHQQQGRLPPGLRPRNAQTSSPTSPAPLLSKLASHSSPAAATSDSGSGSASPPTPRNPTPDPRSAATYRWTIPQRLAVDTRKLAAVTNARRKRLQALVAPEPQPAEAPLIMCRSPPVVA